MPPASCNRPSGYTSLPFPPRSPITHSPSNELESPKVPLPYPCFFPNVLFGFQNDHYYAILIEPISHDRTVEHVAIYYAERSMTEARFAAMRAKNAQMWKSIFVEDVAVVEGMQKGRSAPGFDGGKFSPVMDGPTHRFHAWVAEQLTR